VIPVVWHPLASVKETSLLGDFVCTRLSNMRRRCAFPFTLAGLFLFYESEYDNRFGAFLVGSPKDCTIDAFVLRVVEVFSPSGSTIVVIVVPLHLTFVVVGERTW